MPENNSQTFVLVKDTNGEKYLCPLDTVQSTPKIDPDEIDDCVGEEVVGRYAGNIRIKSN